MEEYKESPWGKIPIHWRISSVKEETDVVTDYVANGSFASLAENVKYKTEKDYAVLIRLVDYNNQFKGDFVYIDKNAYEFLGKSKLYGDEIIISNVGANVGTVFKCPHLEYRMSLAPNSIMVKFKGNNDFYYYWLKSHFGQHMLQSIVTGSAQPKFNKTNFKDLQIPVPPLDEQESIASILKSLDDKIEVNRRINDNFNFAFFEVMLIWLLTSLRNDNLEQQAQALFKSWFVDFEPFRDQPFVESELGMIPEGWRVGRYEEIIETTISGDWGKEKPEGNYIHKVACIRGCDFQDIKNGLRGNTPERYILEKNYQSKHFHHNDVLVEISGGTQTVSTGRVCLVSQLLIDKFNADIVCTNFCRVIRPIAAYAAYLYYSWLYKYNGKVMFGYENGTSGIKNFRIKDFISVEPVVIPPADLLGKFQQFVDNVQIQIQTRGSESSRLASLRDTLLPRLMSGEIKVEDVTL